MNPYIIDINSKYKEIFELAAHEMSYAAHDADHVMRVCRLCVFLAQDQKDIDMDVLIPAALLHDIARRLEDEDPTGKTDHALVGAAMAEKILLDLGYEQELVAKIKRCIASHRFRSGLSPDSIEARILYDADKLDVIGAVGIARSYMLAGRHGERMYRDVPLEQYLQENIEENGRIKDTAKHAMNLEFELKLKYIPDKLFTAKARELARERIAFMQNFFAVIRQEINGER
jgi:uncharacterized protein